MAKLEVQLLSSEGFRPYGTIASLTPPAEKPLVDNGPIKFWPDCGGVLSAGMTGGNQLSIGVCQVGWRELVIDTVEYHDFASEGILPIDGAIYLHVAAPTADDCSPDEENFEVFLVPMGTMVILKPGVWHHAPFATYPGAVVNTMIILPQRTYKIDCDFCNVTPAIEFKQ